MIKSVRSGSDPEAGPFGLPAMAFANTLKGQSDFARVKGYHYRQILTFCLSSVSDTRCHDL